MVLHFLVAITSLASFAPTHEASNSEDEKGLEVRKIVVVVSDETDFKILVGSQKDRATARNFLVNKKGELSLYSSKDPFFTRTISPAAAAEDARKRAVVVEGTCYVILRIKDPNSISVSQLSELLNEFKNACSENFDFETRFDFIDSEYKTHFRQD